MSAPKFAHIDQIYQKEVSYILNSQSWYLENGNISCERGGSYQNVRIKNFCHELKNSVPSYFTCAYHFAYENSRRLASLSKTGRRKNYNHLFTSREIYIF